MSRALWGILILALAGVLTAFLFNRSGPPAAPPPGGAAEGSALGEVPSFTLTNQAGQLFTSDSLRGRVWVADFIFTSCAGTCPQMSERMSRLQRDMPPEVHLVSISVDPKRDTPAVLADYARRYGADPKRWHFLTGEQAGIQRLVSQGFRLSYAEGADPAEPIIHSVRFVLVDPAGVIRGYYDSTDPAALRRLGEEARRLLS